MATATSAIREKLRGARIIASDETTTRTHGVIQWQWVFISDQACCTRSRRAGHAASPQKCSGITGRRLGVRPLCRPAGSRWGTSGLPRPCSARRSICINCGGQGAAHAEQSLEDEVLLTNRDVSATNNISEREIRPSVVFRKVANGFRSDWGAQIHADTAPSPGLPPEQRSALAAVRDLVDGKFAVN